MWRRLRFPRKAENAQLIALSATPEPERPPEIPAGNLSARLTISPEGGAAAPAATPSESGTRSDGTAHQRRARRDVECLRCGCRTARDAGNAGSARSSRPPAAPGVAASRSQPSSLLDRIQPGMAPEALLGPKRVYTLRFSMPNLSSATGSWVLSFTELVAISARSQRALRRQPS